MASQTAPTVSIVVPTHNRRERLPKTLNALTSQPAMEIVVVVNGIRDGSIELLEARASKDTRLTPVWLEGASQTCALQVGVEHSRGDIVLMLDDDVLPEPGLVEGHARRHARARDLVVVGYMPVIRPPRRKPGEYPTDLYSRAYERVCDEYERDPRSILRGIWAGNVSLRRSDCLRIGIAPIGAASTGYSYHGDREFGLRCEKAGMRATFDRSLLAMHDHRITPEAFLQAAQNSGRTRWAVHAEHEGTIGPLSTDIYEEGLSTPGRLLVRIARRKLPHRPIHLLLPALVRGAGALRLFRLESHAGYLMGTIEQQRAAMSAAASAKAEEEGGAP